MVVTVTALLRQLACRHASNYLAGPEYEEDMEKKLLYKRVKGPMDNYEDWYYLVKLDDGQLQVEHSWSHVTPSLKIDSGSQTYTVDEFTQSTDVHSNAQIALKDALAKQ